MRRHAPRPQAYRVEGPADREPLRLEGARLQGGGLDQIQGVVVAADDAALQAPGWVDRAVRVNNSDMLHQTTTKT